MHIIIFCCEHTRQQVLAFFRSSTVNCEPACPQVGQKKVQLPLLVVSFRYFISLTPVIALPNRSGWKHFLLKGVLGSEVIGCCLLCWTIHKNFSLTFSDSQSMTGLKFEEKHSGDLLSRHDCLLLVWGVDPAFCCSEDLVGLLKFCFLVDWCIIQFFGVVFLW